MNFNVYIFNVVFFYEDSFIDTYPGTECIGSLQKTLLLSDTSGQSFSHSENVFWVDLIYKLLFSIRYYRSYSAFLEVTESQAFGVCCEQQCHCQRIRLSLVRLHQTGPCTVNTMLEINSTICRGVQVRNTCKVLPIYTKVNEITLFVQQTK